MDNNLPDIAEWLLTRATLNLSDAQREAGSNLLPVIEDAVQFQEDSGRAGPEKRAAVMRAVESHGGGHWFQTAGLQLVNRLIETAVSALAGPIAARAVGAILPIVEDAILEEL